MNAFETRTTDKLLSSFVVALPSAVNTKGIVVLVHCCYQNPLKSQTVTIYEQARIQQKKHLKAFIHLSLIDFSASAVCIVYVFCQLYDSCFFASLGSEANLNATAVWGCLMS